MFGRKRASSDKAGRGSGRRRWLWAVVSVFAFFVLLAGALLLPPVQRRIVLGVFPAGPGVSVEFGSLHVGLGAAHLRGLRIDWHGLKVSADEAEARYSLLSLVASRTARVDRLRARGLIVDLRSMERTEPSPADSGEPFRFEGLRPFARLPLRAALSGVDIDSQLLFPAPKGGTVRMHAVLTGRDIAPGATGELGAEVTVRVEAAESARDVLVGSGSLKVHESADGVLDLLVYRGDGRPADPAVRGGAGISVDWSADLTAPDESYRLEVATTGAASRRVAEVTATRRASDGKLAGNWTAQLDAGQAQPYLGDFAPPDFALKGEGTFEHDSATRTTAIDSRFEASASRWDRLYPDLKTVGPLTFDAVFAGSFAGPRLEVRSLSARMAPAGGEPVLDIGAEQPFRVDTKEWKFEASRWGAPLVHLRLDGVPAVWWNGSDTGLVPLAGTAGGALELIAIDPRSARLRSSAPVSLSGVRLRSAARELGPMSVRTNIDATLTPGKVEAALAGLRAEFADQSRLAFDGSFAMPRDGRLVASLTGDLAMHSSAISRTVPQIETVHAHGTFGFDLPGSTLSLVAATVDVADGGGRKLVEGSVATVRPLIVDLHDFKPRWAEFEPESLRLRLDGFPIAWAGRYLPQIRIESGALYGNLGATVGPDRSVRIAGEVPFEVRDTTVSWGDLPVLSGAHLEVSPAIILSRQSIEADFRRIAFGDERGNRFEGNVDVRGAPGGAGAGFRADFKAFAPSLTRRIGNLGEFEVHAEGSFDGRARALKLASASFDCRDPDGRSYLAGKSVQPFTVGLAKFEITPDRDSSELFRATFTPLEIEKLFPEALGFALTGPLPSGEAVITASEGGLLFHAPRPLEFGPVTVTRNGVPFLDHVRFTFMPEISYSSNGVRSRETTLEIFTAGKRIAKIGTRGVFDIIGAKPERNVEMTIDADIPALLDQPVGRGLPQFRGGKLFLSSQMSLGSLRTFDAALNLTGLVRSDGLTAPDFRALAHLEEESPGTFRIEAPVRLTAPGRTSDLTAAGLVRLDDAGAAVDLTVASERIVVDDVAALARALIPPSVAGAADTKPAEPGGRQVQTLISRFGPGDGGPIWGKVRGKIPLRFASIEFDRYAVRDLHATVESTREKFAFEDIGATFLEAGLTGRAALTFDGAGPAPVYGVDATLGVANVDFSKIFTTVDATKKPTVEGLFRLDAGIHGTGPDPVVALFECSAALDAEGRDGVFRGLVPGAKSASRLLRAAGALTFSKELRATGRLIGQLQELKVDQASIRLHRDPSRGLLLDSLEMKSDALVIRGTGSARRERGVPLVDRQVQLEVELAAKGDAAIVFDGLDLLGPEAGADGLRPVTSKFRVEGTVAAPDASELWKTLDDAAEKATGSFGWALRKAMKMASEPAPAP